MTAGAFPARWGRLNAPLRRDTLLAWPRRYRRRRAAAAARPECVLSRVTQSAVCVLCVCAPLCQPRWAHRSAPHSPPLGDGDWLRLTAAWQFVDRLTAGSGQKVPAAGAIGPTSAGADRRRHTAERNAIHRRRFRGRAAQRRDGSSWDRRAQLLSVVLEHSRILSHAAFHFPMGADRRSQWRRRAQEQSSNGGRISTQPYPLTRCTAERLQLSIHTMHNRTFRRVTVTGGTETEMRTKNDQHCGQQHQH